MKLLVLFLSLGLMAAASVNAAELKIGVVNAAKVLEMSPQKMKALARLETEFDKRGKSLENKIKKLRKEQEKLAKDGAVLSESARKSKERDIISQQRDLQRQQDEYGEDLSIRRNEELRKLEKSIAETIVALAKKEKYDIVVYQGVIYASEKADLTDKVLAILKKKK